MPQPESVSFEEFRVILCELLSMEAERLTPEAYFVSDLGVDSIRMVEVFLRLREMGVDVSPEMAWGIGTVGDAYRVYTECTAHGEDGMT